MYIEVQRLRARGRRGHHDLVLRELCLEVQSREIVGVVGPSGSGKTTLLQVLLGLTPSEEGKVRVDEQTNAHRRPEFLKSLGYVPQKRVAPPGFTPRHLIAFRGSLGGLAEDAARHRAATMLSAHGLDSVADTVFAELSAEQAEAVHLLASVVHRPKVWFVDAPKPTSVFSALITEARTMGRAAVICTRSEDLAQTHCDRVLRLQNGTLSGLIPTRDTPDVPNIR